MKDEEKMTFRPFYISFDWVSTSPDLHWKQQKISISDGFGHILQDWKVFGVHFSFFFISFTCHTTHCDFFFFLENY
jgi:hypothetical protein